jgi:hypothetical protein
MTRFHGEVGYGESVETPPGSGNWVVVVEEFPYSGHVIRNTRALEETEKVNDDINIGNSISIVADQYAFDHIFNIKYAMWMGKRWKVTTVEVQRPRLLLTLGGLYNGPTP